MKLTIGTRRSDLASIQGRLVGDALLNSYKTKKDADTSGLFQLEGSQSQLEINYLQKNAEGDIDQKTPLSQLPDKGVFTRNLSSLLVSGEIDLAVHSWKDCPTVTLPSTQIVGTLIREDPRDMLLVRKDSWSTIKKNKAITVLSSSPRREYNITPFLKWSLPTAINTVSFLPVRGNIQTRLAKLFAGEGDALIVAKAALSRILRASSFPEAAIKIKEALERCYWSIIPLTCNPTAAGQGALAIEINSERQDLKDLIKTLSDPQSLNCVTQERAILQKYGGGCHQKIGVTVINHRFGEITFLAGETDAGEKLNNITLKSVLPLPPKAAPNQIWPSEEPLNILTPKLFSPAQPRTRNIAYLISKDLALPQKWKISFNTVVYCAGLETWKKLAQRGVWVNGSMESLGESFDNGMFDFIASDTHWIKLGHDKAVISEKMQLFPTYTLKFTRNPPRLLTKTHFYWRSASLFKAVLSTNPQILHAWHACGLGNSYDKIAECLPDKKKLSVWLSYEDWKNYVTNV
ncbi:MAG: hydroxymethylbilane synthase [Bdellovibrionota bacterium]